MLAQLRNFAITLVVAALVYEPVFTQADEIPSPPKSIVADPQINSRLNELVSLHKVTGIVAGIVRGPDLIAIGAAGVRKINSPELMTIDDKLHLGSCTKAMTATRIAMLVEAGKLEWDSTLASVFPDDIQDVHPDLQQVTLTQLLTHRASVPANVAWHELGASLSTTQQRLALLRTALKEAPSTKPGTTFLYSNVGYALAGAMAERVTGQSWEELMQEGLFKPLGMTSAGFGPPGPVGAVEQPWGHAALGGIMIPTQRDNPPSIGPAGIVHASLAAWAKFAALHLQGARGDAKLIRPETFLRLQTPPEGAKYAMGWAIASPPWAKGRVLAHDGSNTMWYASICLIPERDLAFLVGTNRADESAQKASHEVIRWMLEYVQTVLSKS